MPPEAIPFNFPLRTATTGPDAAQDDAMLPASTNTSATIAILDFNPAPNDEIEAPTSVSPLP